MREMTAWVFVFPCFVVMQIFNLPMFFVYLFIMWMLRFDDALRDATDFTFAPMTIWRDIVVGTRA